MSNGEMISKQSKGEQNTGQQEGKKIPWPFCRCILAKKKDISRPWHYIRKVFSFFPITDTHPETLIMFIQRPS